MMFHSPSELIINLDDKLNSKIDESENGLDVCKHMAANLDKTITLTHAAPSCGEIFTQHSGRGRRVSSKERSMFNSYPRNISREMDMDKYI